ncbi:hypothetical protein SAMN05428978_100914 [Nitrosomonas sp. Nm34]|nr:hypothetical protein SAMN05428978_100914 [Nitrosomonas sp. Nm34]
MKLSQYSGAKDKYKLTAFLLLPHFDFTIFTLFLYKGGKFYVY